MVSIIIEGADCTGKDTLIKELSRATGFDVVRGSSFEISQKGEKEMINIMEKNILEGEKIFNRSFYSNLVYASIFDFPKISHENAKNLTELINDNDVLVVYLFSKVETIVERLLHRGDDDISPNDIESIIYKYNTILFHENKPTKILAYDTEFFSPKQMTADIIKKITN